MDYVFLKHGKFLNLDFNSNPKKVIEVLGKPDKSERYYYKGLQSVEYDETFFYDGDCLRIIFSFIDNEFENTSFFVKKLFVSDVDVFSLKKKEIVEVFKNLSDSKDDLSKLDKCFVDDYLSETYSLSDLGVTLWFENDKLDEVCIDEPLKI